MEINLKQILVLLTLCCSCHATYNQFLANSFYKIFDLFHDETYNDTFNATKAVEEMSVDELGISRGQCSYDFVSFVSHEDTRMCYLDDENIWHLLPNQSGGDGHNKPPIMVKCLKEHPLIGESSNMLRIIASVPEFVNLLKPVGNNTKRYQPGSCVLVFFYTYDCLLCLHQTMRIAKLPYAFPTIPVAAIDAAEFPSFNTEFGIVAVPTLMLFHQGRPVVKYRTTGNFNSFITRHTGLKPIEVPEKVYVMSARNMTQERKKHTNRVLVLSWMFIVACACYYFAQSRLCKQIVEMIKRNWRESEAQMENN